MEAPRVAATEPGVAVANQEGRSKGDHHMAESVVAVGPVDEENLPMQDEVELPNSAEAPTRGTVAETGK